MRSFHGKIRLGFPAFVFSFIAVLPSYCAEAPQTPVRAITLPTDITGLLTGSGSLSDLISQLLSGASPSTLTGLETLLTPLLSQSASTPLTTVIAQALPLLGSSGLAPATVTQLTTLLTSSATIGTLPANATLGDLLAMINSTTSSPAQPNITVGPVLTTKIAGTTGAVAGYPAVFVAGSDQTGATLSWNFGDGTTANVIGTQVSHTFASAGSYTVTVTATNSGVSGANSQTFTVGTLSGSISGVDSDGDGFPNELEAALSTDPLDPASTPFESAPAIPQKLTLSKLSIKLNFTKSLSDAISLTGTLPIPAGFTVLGQQVTVDVGGVINVFTLDAHGSSPKGTNEFKLGVKAGKTVAAQNARFSAVFTKGSFAASLSDEGLTQSSAKNVQKTIPVIVLFNQQYFNLDLPQSYTSTGKTGVTR